MIQKLSISDLEQQVQNGATLIDTRPKESFVEGFIPSSLFLGIDGRMEEWALALIDKNEKIILVCDNGKEAESAARLSKAGFENIIGFLDGGYAEWCRQQKPVDMIINIEADELAMDMPFDSNLVVVDVRSNQEYNNGHVKDATNIPLQQLKDPAQIAQFDEATNLYIHCASGYRSVIASSLLKLHGMHNLRNLAGGWDKIKLEEKIPSEKETKQLN